MSRVLLTMGLLSMGLLSMGKASAEPLGRLFFSVPERAALDAARGAARAPAFDLTDRAAGKRAAIPESPAAQPSVSVDGMITRERGPATLWLNGAPQEAPNVAGPGMPLRVTAGAVEISPGEGRSVVRVKPGQTFDPATGGVSENGAAPGAAP